MTKNKKLLDKLETIAIWSVNLGLMFAYVWNILINII
jgi:hypothetical protein